MAAESITVTVFSSPFSPLTVVIFLVLFRVSFIDVFCYCFGAITGRETDLKEMTKIAYVRDC